MLSNKNPQWVKDTYPYLFKKKKKKYEKHPLYSQFMSTVISGLNRDNEESFKEFVKQKQCKPESTAN